MSNEQILPFYAFPASFLIYFFLLSLFYILPSAQLLQQFERPCIQRFIGCYKYIIRDKYVPSSFQSVCLSLRLSSCLLPLPSSFLYPSYYYKSLLAHKKNKHQKLKEMVSNKSVQRTVAYMLCRVLDASSFQLG